MKIRWLAAEDWKTGHPFLVLSGIRFEPGEPVEVNDQEVIRMARAHPEDFSIEEANDVEEEGKKVKEGEEGERQAENKSGYVPVQKARDKKGKYIAVDPRPAGAVSHDYLPDEE